MSATLHGWLALAAWPALLVCLYWGLRNHARGRLLADTPITRIRSAPQGFVELTGRARMLDGPPILAPLSGLPCVWYHTLEVHTPRFSLVDIYEDLRHRLYYRDWRPGSLRWREVSDALFLIEDGTGRCVVDPEGAEFSMARRSRWYTNDDGVKIFAPFGIGASRRCVEERIMVGDEVHVLGEFRTVGGGREVLDTRREVFELLEEWKRNPRMIALFDRRKNGRIDPDEWEAARRAAHRQVQRRHLEHRSNPAVHTIARPAHRHYPFLISAASEGRIINLYRRHAVLGLLGMLLSVAYLIWFYARYLA